MNKHMKTLREIIKDENLGVETQKIQNYGTDKHIHPYIDEFYEENFSKLRNSKIKLVEIGVRGGASIQLWKSYFSSNAKIYGIDNLEVKEIHGIPVNNDWATGDNVKFIVGDAYSEEIVNKLPNNIDILIDDGPHTFESHVNLIKLYLPKMNKNSMIIIEDISYNVNQLFPHIPNRKDIQINYYDLNGYFVKLLVIKCK